MSGRPYKTNPEFARMVEHSLTHTLTASPIFKRQVQKICANGPRFVGEILAEYTVRLNAPAWCNERMRAYSEMNLAAFEMAGADDWSGGPDLVVIDGGKGLKK